MKAQAGPPAKKRTSRSKAVPMASGALAPGTAPGGLVVEEVEMEVEEVD